MKLATTLGLGGIAAAAIATAVALVPAHAQSGSRLCGYIKKTDDGGYVGYLFEAREAESDYQDDCYLAAESSYEKATGNSWGGDVWLTVRDCHDLPQSKDGWNRHCGSTCEDVGEHFESSNSPKDMCDKMEADHHYKVVFDKASNTTSYHKN